MKKISILLLLLSFEMFAQPTVFNSGEPATAQLVNDNFTLLWSEIQELKVKTERDSIKIDSLRKGSFPIGAIVASMSDSVKFNSNVVGEWVLADGRPGTTEYFNATSQSNVPNLVGQFLRGMDEASSVDPEGATRNPGDIQNGSTALPDSNFVTESKSHSHGSGSLSGSTNNTGDHNHATVRISGGTLFAGGSSYGLDVTSGGDIVGAHSHTVSINSGLTSSQSIQLQVTSGGDAETRPTNVAVYFYIRVK